MKFIFGIHNHQPVGNFDYVFEEAYRKSYLPFLELAERFSFIRFTLHISGPLIEWLEDHYPDYIDRVAALVHRDQVEIISSGFYEPILISISDRDKIGQIQMMNDYIKNRFGKAPDGLWLTERVWEPGLVKPIVKAGIKYLAVDDQHFATAGTNTDRLNGYYLTEDQGYVLGVFPISQKLRYAIPFQDPEATIELLKQNDTGDKSVMVMADDGEKFGIWPGSHDHCYGSENWLERFFQSLEASSSWLEMLTFSDYFHQHKPTGRVYLPTSSYFEMSEWTLPMSLGKRYSHFIESLKTENTFDEIRPYLRGGTWRDFLTKYEESNWMLKRANYVSSLMNGKKDDIAQKAIWRSQCNCGFWHGVFGGLYLPHLRHAIYENIIEAEDRLTDATFQQVDIDKDGTKEILLANDLLRLILTPIGGAIRELDIIPKRFNILNTFSRYEESYHEKLFKLNDPKTDGSASIHDTVTTKEDGLEKYLNYDSHPRWMLMDHFFSTPLNIDRLRANQQEEEGDFLLQEFRHSIDKNAVIFVSDGKVCGQDVSIKKHIRLKKDKIAFTINIRNISDDILECTYGPEFNFSLLGGHTGDRYYLVEGTQPKNPFLDSTGRIHAERFGLVTEWEGIQCELTFESKTEVWRYPVETVSMSEAGFERIYQSSVVLPVWRIKLEPQMGHTLNFELRINTSAGEYANA